MRIYLIAALLFLSFISSNRTLATDPDTSFKIVPERKLSFVIVPYKPMMHLSDADNDISRASDLSPQEIRTQLRLGLLKNLNTKLTLEYESKVVGQDYVENNEDDLSLIYNSLAFSEDTVFPLKANALPDSLKWKKNILASKENTIKSKDKSYINVNFYDQLLLPDLARKHSADYFIFLNELDIKTNFSDCLDLALKIYQREFKVHYSVFDRSGRQVYGDVAVMKFPSNSNDVNEIIAGNFPGISDHIISSVKKVSATKAVAVR